MEPSGRVVLWARPSGVLVLLMCGLIFGGREARACVQAPLAAELGGAYGLGRCLWPII